MLENEQILPNARFEKANERIPMEEWNIKVLFHMQLHE
jgi:hypothetical protein